MNDIYLIDSYRALDISVIDLACLNITEHIMVMPQIIARWEVYTKACFLNLDISARAKGTKPYWKFSSALNVYLAATTETFIIVPHLLLLLFH